MPSSSVPNAKTSSRHSYSFFSPYNSAKLSPPLRLLCTICFLIKPSCQTSPHSIIICWNSKHDHIGYIHPMRSSNLIRKHSAAAGTMQAALTGHEVLVRNCTACMDITQPSHSSFYLGSPYLGQCLSSLNEVTCARCSLLHTHNHVHGHHGHNNSKTNNVATMRLAALLAS